MDKHLSQSFSLLENINEKALSSQKSINLIQPILLTKKVRSINSICIFKVPLCKSIKGYS